MWYYFCVPPQQTHNAYPAQSDWKIGEIDAIDVQNIRQEILSVPHVSPALRDLSDELAVGPSRTVYRYPTDMTPRDPRAAMHMAALTAANVIYWQGIGTIDPANMPIELRDNVLPKDFDPAAMSATHWHQMAAFGSSLIGYVRMEHTETGMEASVGALDLESQTHYRVSMR
jgi:hypothetical protein